MTTAVPDFITTFLHTKCPDSGPIGVDEDLVETGVLNSMHFVELLYLIEAELDTEISMDDVTTDDFRTIANRASASPFEVRIAALEAGPRFSLATDGEILGVALVLRDVLAKIARVLDDPPYNVVVHDAPAAGDVKFHWWIEVVPRVSVVAGFEIGTGVLVNTIDPVNASRQLRDA